MNKHLSLSIVLAVCILVNTVYAASAPRCLLRIEDTTCRDGVVCTMWVRVVNPPPNFDQGGFDVVWTTVHARMWAPDPVEVLQGTASGKRINVNRWRFSIADPVCHGVPLLGINFRAVAANDAPTCEGVSVMSLTRLTGDFARTGTFLGCSPDAGFFVVTTPCLSAK